MLFVCANSFETVLIMRFIFLPYDLVNYLAGILRIDLKAFILATLLGSIPGTIAFVPLALPSISKNWRWARRRNLIRGR